MNAPADSSGGRPSTRRVVTALFGVFFIVMAGAIMASVDESMIVGGIVAAAVIGLLGLEACVSAARDRPSLLQRIGPLP